MQAGCLVQQRIEGALPTVWGVFRALLQKGAQFITTGYLQQCRLQDVNTEPGTTGSK